MRLQGALDGQSATGTARVRALRMRRCLNGYTRQFALRADRVVAGAPAGPRAGALRAAHGRHKRYYPCDGGPQRWSASG